MSIYADLELLRSIVAENLQAAARRLGNMIDRTPTGQDRELLSEANMLTLHALDKLAQVSNLRSSPGADDPVAADFDKKSRL